MSSFNKNQKQNIANNCVRTSLIHSYLTLLPCTFQDFFLRQTFHTFNSPFEKNIFACGLNMIYCEACEASISKCFFNLSEHCKGRRHKTSFDKLKKSSLFMHLVQTNEKLVGMEYVIELIRQPKDYTQNYICSLCSVHSSKHEFMRHLKSPSHEEKYLVFTG